MITTQTVSTVTHDSSYSQLRAVVADGQISRLTFHVRDSEGGWTENIDILDDVTGLEALSIDIAVLMAEVRQVIAQTTPENKES